MAEVTGKHWQDIFANWPGSVPRAGVVVMANGEQVAFKSFMLGEGVVLVERDRPDTSGARKVMIGLDSISAIKTCDPLEMVLYQAFGFAPPPA